MNECYKQNQSAEILNALPEPSTECQTNEWKKI